MHYTTICKENSNKGGLDTMEWMNRGGSAPQQNNQQPAAPSAAGTANRTSTASGGKQKKNNDGKVWRIASVVLLFGVTLLFASLIAYLAIVRPAGHANQGKYVDTSKFQAVFLNGGQVYFGKIQTTNDKYIRMSDIYYLRVNQQVQPNGQTANGDVQLVKLGCELHGPDDQMVINNDQIIFWENLKNDGQVAQAVAKYIKENPDGQKCQTTSQQSQSNSTTPAADTTTNKKQ